MQDLKITLIQSETYWHQIEANLAMFEEKIWKISEKTDVIVLPEMFSTGFTMEADRLAEPPNSKTFRWMEQMAAQSGAMIIGSYIIKEGAARYNRLYAMGPDGNHYSYDKRHLFRMAEEHRFYTGGTAKTIIEWKGWKILPLICYDLRFPVWSRNRVSADRLDYDAILFVANWPEARVTSWDTLLKARAIENLSYSIGVNRTGEDGKGVMYNGHSAVYGPKGETILFMGEKDSFDTVTLSMESLMEFRSKFPAYFDSDAFEI